MSRLPTSRFKRALDLAKVGARAGASWAASRGVDAAAKRSAEVLGNLRGLAAKIGQTASYVDGLIPPEQRETYEKALKTLQKATPASSYESVSKIIEQDLGASVSELFLQFEETPSASASIGQVHRATLPDGTRVAVKVQHEGIDEAVESDLKNIGMLEGVISLAGPRGLEAKPIFEEVIRRFRAELDYRAEARQQQAFREFHSGDELIRLPAVFNHMSSRRVLTTEWVDGLTMDEAMTQPEELRALYAQALWRFVFRGNLVGGAFNADPHPGNYIFHPDGTVHFLDFGCVQPISDSTRHHAVRAHQAALIDDLSGFDAAIAAMLKTQGGAFGEASRIYTRRLFEPLLTNNYRLTRDYAAGLIKAAQVMKKSMTAKDGSFVSPPPQLALMNRLQFGFYSVLALLDVEVSYRDVERGFLPEAAQTQSGLLSADLLDYSADRLR